MGCPLRAPYALGIHTSGPRGPGPNAELDPLTGWTQTPLFGN